MKTVAAIDTNTVEDLLLIKNFNDLHIDLKHKILSEMYKNDIFLLTDAVIFNFIWVFKYLDIYPMNEVTGSHVWDIIASIGNLKIAQIIFEKRVPGLSINTINLAIDYGHLNILAWMKQKNIINIPGQITTPQTIIIDPLIIIVDCIYYKHLDIVKWVYFHCTVNNLSHDSPHYKKISRQQVTLCLIDKLISVSYDDEYLNLLYRILSKLNISQFLDFLLSEFEIELFKFIFENVKPNKAKIYKNAIKHNNLEIIKWLDSK